MTRKLNAGQKHILRLTQRDANAEGWAKVSSQLYPVFKRVMPSELVEFDTESDPIRVRLTEEGKSVVGAMEWL